MAKLEIFLVATIAVLLVSIAAAEEDGVMYIESYAYGLPIESTLVDIQGYEFGVQVLPDGQALKLNVGTGSLVVKIFKNNPLVWAAMQKLTDGSLEDAIKDTANATCDKIFQKTKIDENYSSLQILVGKLFVHSFPTVANINIVSYANKISFYHSHRAEGCGKKTVVVDWATVDVLKSVV